MPVLKAPPKLIRNATIQVRVEEEVDLKLRMYAEFINASPAFVVAESLKLLFNKDAEFREWLTHRKETPAPAGVQKAFAQESPRPRAATRTMFDETPQQSVGK